MIYKEFEAADFNVYKLNLAIVILKQVIYVKNYYKKQFQ